MSRKHTMELMRRVQERIISSEPTATWELELAHLCGPECRHSPWPHAVAVRPRCHEEAPVSTIYYQGRLMLTCKECGKMIALLALAEPANSAQE